MEEPTMKEIVDKVFKTNTEKMVDMFRELKKDLPETEAAFEVFKRAQVEIGGDIFYTIASCRAALMETFKKEDENLLRESDTLYQFIKLYERKH